MARKRPPKARERRGPSPCARPTSSNSIADPYTTRPWLPWCSWPAPRTIHRCTRREERRKEGKKERTKAGNEEKENASQVRHRSLASAGGRSLQHVAFRVRKKAFRAVVRPPARRPPVTGHPPEIHPVRTRPRSLTAPGRPSPMEQVYQLHAVLLQDRDTAEEDVGQVQRLQEAGDA